MAIINKSWYYFNKPEDGAIEGLIKKVWNIISRIWYYFSYTDGEMAHDEWIDGYCINSNGV